MLNIIFTFAFFVASRGFVIAPAVPAFDVLRQDGTRNVF